MQSEALFYPRFLESGSFLSNSLFFTSKSPYVLSVDQSHYAQRIIFFQSIRQILIRNVLVTNGAQKPKNSSGSHAGCAWIRGSGIGASVHHGVAYFYAGRIGIENDPTYFFLQDRK